MKKALSVIALLLILALGATLFGGKPSSEQPPPTADASSLRHTVQGPVIGYQDIHNTHAWLGIPFAQPPVDDLRWRAPQPAVSWQAPRQALNGGRSCKQFWGILGGEDGQEGEAIGSEDCLYLNLWAPKFAPGEVPIDAQRLPVMVWIHGGGNSIGTGNVYRGHHLAADQNTIVVSVNYRLGLFGWFNHPALRNTSQAAEDASGNYGTLDLIAALEWVQDNIGAFGGDPDNVTIFGESAGGRNVYALLGSPLAKGLFHKGIIQSGSNQTAPLAQAVNYSDAPEPGMAMSSNEVLAKLLVADKSAANRNEAKSKLQTMNTAATSAYLRSKSADELLASARSAVVGMGMYPMPQNIRDGHVLPKMPLLKLFEDPAQFNSVPLILGTNRDEQKTFMAQDPRLVSQWFGIIPRIKDLEQYNLYASYFSDNWKALAVDEPARVLQAAQGEKVFAYRFDWDESPSNILADLPSLLGAGHGLEINFVFGDFDDGFNLAMLQSEDNMPGREALSEAMMNYWGEFAHSGDPGTGRNGKQTAWAAWQPEGDKLMLLDTPAAGGPRMTDLLVSAASLKQRLRDDTRFASQQDRCRTYAQLFLHSYQTDQFWQADEYAALGCSEFPHRQFAP